MSPYLQVQGLVKRYGPVIALDGIDLAVERSSVLGLLGPNGAGKSTLFGCLLGLIRPTVGKVTLGGGEITDAIRSRFGYTPERVSLYPHQTVWENGIFFAGLRGHGADELERQLARLGLERVRDRKVSQLSKGLAQRVALAIALCGAPELVVLDEPFNGLDPVLLDTFQNVLREESERGATLLISTHTISAIESLATHIAILLDGKLALSGSLDQVRIAYPHAASLEAIYYSVARERVTLIEEVAA